jgi:GntR family transcriptional regulator, transcriptional repressor for pyruvate dehydrogenase complex
MSISRKSPGRRVAVNGSRTARATASEKVANGTLEDRASQHLFDPIERAPAYTRVSSAIEQKILSRSLPAGDALPAETELARQFGVNRSTVREALRRLESAGLIGRSPGAKRMVVTRPHADELDSGVRRALVMHEVSFIEVWEAMMVIEPAVAELAAQRCTKDELLQLSVLQKEFAASARGDVGSVNLVAQFFEELGRCARNTVLVMAKRPLAQVLAPTLARMIDRVPQARSRITQAQRQIVAALQARDPERARLWMTRHVRDFKKGYEFAGIEPETRVEVG